MTRDRGAAQDARADDLRRIGAFLDAQAAESGAARNTLLGYGRDLRDLAAFAAGRGIALTAITRDQIEGYMALKWDEIYQYEHTPHPVEFQLYYSC